jgi:hypothetical protein
MSAKLAERVRDAFKNPIDRDRIEQYLDNVREKLKDIDTALGRSVGTILLLVAIFELLNRAAISQVRLGPFTIADTSFIRTGLVVITSYYFYDMTYLFAHRLQMTQVFKAVTRLAHPAWDYNDIVRYLYPQRTSLIPRNFEGLEDVRAYKLLSRLIWFIPWGGSIIWLIYAYIVEFRHSHVAEIAVWGALFLTLYFVLLAFLILAKLDTLDETNT